MSLHGVFHSIHLIQHLSKVSWACLNQTLFGYTGEASLKSAVVSILARLIFFFYLASRFQCIVQARRFGGFRAQVLAVLLSQIKSS